MELPGEVAYKLSSRYSEWKASSAEKDRERFLGTLRAVYDSGWPNAEVARALDLSRERIRQLVLESDTIAKLPHPGVAVPPAPVVVPLSEERARERQEAQDAAEGLLNYYVDQMEPLLDAASRARGNHDPESPERIAANTLTDLLLAASDDGVSIPMLAARLGKSPGALRSRMRTTSRIGRLGKPNINRKTANRDPKQVEAWARKIRPLLDATASGGPNVDKSKANKVRLLIREAVDSDNISITELARALDRSYHSIWMKYMSDLSA